MEFFQFIMNILTSLNTVIIINWNFRSPCIFKISKWMRIVFIQYLPRILCMKIHLKSNENEEKLSNLITI